MSQSTAAPNAPLASRRPRHVAIIMDGNGRWARQRGKLRVAGHRAGIKAVRRAIRFAVDQGLEALTLYAFSCENWQRPEQEVAALLTLFVFLLERRLPELHRYDIRLRVIGDKRAFSQSLQDHIARAEAITADKDRLTLTIAANYSGRWDIVQAAGQLARSLQRGECTPEQINEQLLGRYLCLSDLPEVDLVIRTSGEYRISNFLLWQIAYAEFYFTEQLWPDFDERTFGMALHAFSQRERRFGGLNSASSATLEH